MDFRSLLSYCLGQIGQLRVFGVFAEDILNIHPVCTVSGRIYGFFREWDLGLSDAEVLFSPIGEAWLDGRYIAPKTQIEYLCIICAAVGGYKLFCLSLV